MRINPLLSRLTMLLTLPFAATTAMSAPDPAPYMPYEQRELLLSTLWTQCAPEYQLLALAAFKQAQEKLSAAVQTPGSAAPEQQNAASLPAKLAVIVDLDETMLDNSAYQAHLVGSGLPYDHAHSWLAWIAKQEAKAVPGAVAFSQFLEKNNIAIFYVSNRSCGDVPDCTARADTMKNMKALGFARASEQSAFLLKGEKPAWSDDKTTRRAELANEYRIIMLLGDDLRDFLPGDQADKLASGDTKVAEFAQTMLGSRWFLLPNPMYGSWLRRAAPGGLAAMYQGLSPVDLGSAARQNLTLATWNLEWMMTPQTYAQLKPGCTQEQPKTKDRAFPCTTGRPPVPARSQADYDAMSQVAATISADVIGLQEVDGAEAARLVFRDGWQLDCFVNRQHPQKVGFAVRNGVVYRCNHELTGLDADGASRAGADITLYPQTPNEVRLLAVHLKSSCTKEPLLEPTKDACIALRHQLPVLAAWVDARAAEGVPYAILGDFNRLLEQDAATPIGPDPSAPNAVFNALSDGKPAGARLVRATEINPDGDCSTLRKFQHPDGSIDNILVSTQLLANRTMRVSRIKYSEAMADTRKLSDHCPLIAEIK
jgi:5'-nucleotidase (lipoprotein e(P4) family)